MQDKELTGREAMADCSRRDLFSRSLGTGIVLAGAWVAGCGSRSGTLRPAIAQTGSDGNVARDIDILNFALNLEYLDSEYYTYATTGQGIEAFGVGITGQGTAGPTVGGGRISFGDARLEAIANQIAADERAHVNVLRQTITQLGGTPIAKPRIDLATPPRNLGIDPTTPDGFLLATRSFEDVAVSAYTGTSRFLFNPDVIQNAGRAAVTEAYHGGVVRLLIAQRNLTAVALDGKDIPPPPATQQYFPTEIGSTGFPPVRTPREVLNIVLQAQTGNETRGGFFPNGPNGNLATLLALT
ncbi:MAG: ferritin-like domain-containing protein [Capsulimonadales bacterium]|nr:ferritin-like domain-containing protein [Capsulimonadales bacterium]